MKNTVMVPLVFFFNLLLWIVVLSFFSVFASSAGMTTLTAGSVFVFLYECLYRAVYYFPLSLSFALVTVYFFLMRHKTIYWITALLVLALLVGCVFLVMPLSYRFVENNSWNFVNNRSIVTRSTDQVFSPYRIRPDRDSTRMVWYSVREQGTKVSPLIVARSEQSDSVFTHYPEAVYDRTSGGLMAGDVLVVNQAAGRDPLFLSVFTPPPAVARASNYIDRVARAFLQAFRQGFVPYTMFSSAFFLSMALLWLFCHATGWRLLNILFTVSALLYLYRVYPLFSEGTVFLFFRQILPKSFSPESVTSFLYFLQAAIFALAGFFVTIRRMIQRMGQEA